MSSVVVSGGINSVVYWIRKKEHTDMTCEGYIGVSCQNKKRWKDHQLSYENKHLGNAIKKYGWENLIKEILIIASSDYCLFVENKLRPKANVGWNIAAGGGKPPLTKWNLGKRMSEETKQKISMNRKGIKHTSEMQARLNLNLLIGGEKTRFKKGHLSWILGKSHSPESIQKMRLIKTGKKLSEETRKRISASNMGRKMNDYTKQRLREANINRTPPMRGKHFPKVSCPHCGKTGGLSGMKCWHFDNCRIKEAA